MVRECRPPAREPARSWLVRRSTTTTSTFANASSPASMRPVGPPPAITTACSRPRGASTSELLHPVREEQLGQETDLRAAAAGREERAESGIQADQQVRIGEVFEPEPELGADVERCGRRHDEVHRQIHSDSHPEVVRKLESERSAHAEKRRPAGLVFRIDGYARIEVDEERQRRAADRDRSQRHPEPEPEAILRGSLDRIEQVEPDPEVGVGGQSLRVSERYGGPADLRADQDLAGVDGLSADEARTGRLLLRMST